MRKILNIFAFFKSTLAVNLACSMIPLYFGGIEVFVSIFLSFGFIVSISLKEVYNQSNYIFYFNNGLSKLQLWLYSYMMNVFFVFVISSIVSFIKQLL